MEKKVPGGVVFPLVTPFDEKEEVNYTALGQLIDFLIENGAHGVIPCGSTGELVSMTREEQRAINEFTVRHVNGRVKVYACTAAYRTSDAVETSAAAERAGADGIMVVTPWYIIPNEPELHAHYEAVRRAVSCPVIMYHNPYLTGCHVTAEFMAGLYRDGLIDGCKDSDHDIYRHQTMRALTDDGFAIFYGYDNCPAEALTFYADGWITGVGTLFPAETVRLFNLAKAGDIAGCKAFTLNTMRRYMRFFNEPTREGLPTPWLAIIKEGLTMRGIDIGVPRRPIAPLPDSVRDDLRETLKAMGHYRRG